MNEIELIVDMLMQTFDGRAWHGPSFMSVVNGVTKAQASGRPVEKGHTIWEIVSHCSYWMDAVTKALHSQRMPDIKTDEDWPKMGKTEQDWIKTQEVARKACNELTHSLKNLDKDIFTQKVHGSYNGEPYSTTYRRMIHGISDHNTYHSGQIAILKKMMQTQNR
ncbi:MAG: DinB family protein [Candidatus Bathyarchaeota archaeon]|nr:MAG: DinB family protein [Candidatus Bathyarchaeota archaeon]